ncbi:MAG: hypothetical protein NVSMB17_12210 [Candidatus Dormibacteria bacterium]
MAVAGYVLIAVGAIVSLVGGIMLLIAAFRASIWWGLGSIFVPFVSLIFVITHWATSRRPFFIQLAGVVLVFVGVAIAAAGGGVPSSTPTVQ